jgi:hypothetical protein
VSILRTVCPECKVSLKSTDPDGFTPGQALDCPKCGVTFAVEALAAKPARPRVLDDEDEPPRKKARPRMVDDEDEDDRPRGRRRRDDGDEDDEDRPRKKRKKTEEGGYRTSPLRLIILGILVAIMLVLGFLLYQKWQREKEEAAATRPAPAMT